jgi:hypothetical protein
MQAPQVSANYKRPRLGPRPLFSKSIPFYRKTPWLWLICARHPSSTSEQREGETWPWLGWRLTGGEDELGEGRRGTTVDDELVGALGFANGGRRRSIHARRWEPMNGSIDGGVLGSAPSLIKAPDFCLDSEARNSAWFGTNGSSGSATTSSARVDHGGLVWWWREEEEESKMLEWVGECEWGTLECPT